MTAQKVNTAGLKRKEAREGIGPLVRSALWLWARSGLHGIAFLLRAGLRFYRANRRRRRRERRLGVHIPTVLVISATMRCNYDCRGCYSRGRPEDDELGPADLDALLAEAEGLGFLAVLITGGEPFLRQELPELTARHRRLLFIIITNGSQVSPDLAHRIARSGNTIILVSVEGFPEDTDARRGAGAHRIALQAMGNLRRAGVLFGFSVTNSAANTERLGSDAFIDEMISRGCIAGLFSEYVPCGPDPHREWLLDDDRRAAFQQRVLELRASRPIALVQFPQDEYGEANRCTAAGRSSLHINPQGGIEPCPFVPVAAENVRQGGLMAAIRSPFLQSIREQPHLLRRERYACALFEHLAEIEALQKQASPES